MFWDKFCLKLLFWMFIDWSLIGYWIGLVFFGLFDMIFADVKTLMLDLWVCLVHWGRGSAILILLSYAYLYVQKPSAQVLFDYQKGLSQLSHILTLFPSLILSSILHSWDANSEEFWSFFKKNPFPLTIRGSLQLVSTTPPSALEENEISISPLSASSFLWFSM